MTEIEKIYYEYQNNLDVDDSKEVKAARDYLFAFLDGKGLSAFEYEDAVGSLTSENEKQGFLSGFKYAMKIALECIQSKTE